MIGPRSFAVKPICSIPLILFLRRHSRSGLGVNPKRLRAGANSSNKLGETFVCFQNSVKHSLACFLLGVSDTLTCAFFKEGRMNRMVAHQLNRHSSQIMRFQRLCVELALNLFDTNVVSKRSYRESPKTAEISCLVVQEYQGLARLLAEGGES